ncbi:MAG: lysophospholipid acyltransferase family protein [Phycisphaerae bacterium]|nr:lysophospholipid acyltransferase family protein [Phycisphaerae bacterium]
MRRTYFDTPIIKHLMGLIAVCLLKAIGWHLGKGPPDIKKFVLIGAPHTSNWDFPIVLSLAFRFRVKVFWMGKDSLFRWPIGWFFYWLGGIPIDRSKRMNTVEQTIEVFNENEELVIVIPPEATRKKVQYWKSGFYWIARGAKIPVVLGYLDYERKEGGFGPAMMMSDDVEADLKRMWGFYANIPAKHPKRVSPAVFRPQEPEDSSEQPEPVREEEETAQCV